MRKQRQKVKGLQLTRRSRISNPGLTEKWFIYTLWSGNMSDNFARMWRKLFFK